MSVCVQNDPHHYRLLTAFRLMYYPATFAGSSQPKTKEKGSFIQPPHPHDHQNTDRPSFSISFLTNSATMQNYTVMGTRDDRRETARGKKEKSRTRCRPSYKPPPRGAGASTFSTRTYKSRLHAICISPQRSRSRNPVSAAGPEVLSAATARRGITDKTSPFPSGFCQLLLLLISGSSER